MHHDKNFSSPFERFFVSNPRMPPQREWKIANFFSWFGDGLGGVYSNEAKLKIKRLISEAKPDIAHIHNIYHHISPSILTAIKKNRIPIVMTVNDYKLICPNYCLFDGERICEKCKDHKYYHAISSRCFKNSHLYGLLVCLEAYAHKILRLYEKNIDAFIAPSLFLKDKLMAFGINSKKIHVLRNFIELDDSKDYEPFVVKQDYFIYLGRLEKIKGTDVLIKAVEKSKLAQRYELKIIGEGKEKNSLMEYCIKNNIKNVTFCGFLPHDQIKKMMKHSIMTIVPSICYDVAPTVIVESFAMGKPVIASRIGGIPELVSDNKDGLLCNPGDVEDLREKIEYLLTHPYEAVAMGKAGRDKVENLYNPRVHLEGLLNIYRSVGVRC